MKTRKMKVEKRRNWLILSLMVGGMALVSCDSPADDDTTDADNVNADSVSVVDEHIDTFVTPPMDDTISLEEVLEETTDETAE